MPTLAEELHDLEQAVDGLLVMSETDAPLLPFVWPAGLPFTTSAIIAASSDMDLSSETLALGDFFAPMTAEQDWYGEEELATAARFQALQSWLAEHLENVQVYRIGGPDIQVYIGGTDPNGRVIGLTTHQVET